MSDESPSKANANTKKTVPEKPESGSDVIVLDDDEQPVVDLVGKVAAGDRKCINYLCQSGVDLFTPPIFCTSFYRVRVTEKNKKQKICRECYDEAVQYYDELCSTFTEGEDIMEVDYPIRNETFAIDDSDSDDEKDDEEDIMVDESTLTLLEANFDDVLTETLRKYKYEDTVDAAIMNLKKKHGANQESYLEVKTMVDSVRKEVDSMLLGLFGKLRVENISLPELLIPGFDQDVSSSVLKTIETPAVQKIEPPKDLPARGLISKPPIRLGQYYYAKRNSSLCSWVKVKLENIFSSGHAENPTNQTMYQVSRENNMNVPLKRLVSDKDLAYSKPVNVLLEVGARVIALFKEFGDDAKTSRRDAYYPGVVGESPTQLNRYRYLIFFDDGYAHYVSHNNVFLICNSSKDVWEDVSQDSKAFIKKYITEYPNRSMVKLTCNQTVRTEFRGKWYVTTVLKTDCSLAQIFFESLNRVEWIYRGSRRLDAIFKEGQAVTSRLQNKINRPRAAITNTTSKTPFIQYSRGDDQDVILISDDKGPQRSVAKKSTRTSFTQTNNQISQPQLNLKPFLPPRPEGPPGKIVYYTPRKQNPSSKIFRQHKCTDLCQKEMPTTLQRLKGYGPLAKPLLCGFYRLLYKVKSKRPFVIYKTPCGRSIRNVEELHMYLQATKSELTVDLFNFDFWVRCLAEFILEPNKPILKDLSQGVEEIQIPVVNYVDNVLNDFVNYSNVRTPMEGVHLNLDPDFLIGCDCEDDCVNKDKCACWQLTFEGAKYLNKDKNDIGYSYRRLYEPIFTGIYECNSRCKCAKTCLNRVVQHPLSHKLQVFKTANRGWGIRCINDIPQGSFVCIYAGALLTDEMANEGGVNEDDYLAELDYIETVEQYKEDYEEEAYQSEEENSRGSNRDDEDEEEIDPLTKRRYRDLPDNDFIPSTRVNEDGTNIRTRLRKRTSNDLDFREHPSKKPAGPKKSLIDDDETVMISDDEDVREPSSFNPAADNDDRLNKYKSVRLMFGENEKVYIMDAKNTGNIGRYLNHSCSPNIFVQNVFVDTHDLRFPWVSFFAMTYIRAGTELTWNYNYDVGSVQDKKIICRCGSLDCRGRLL